MKLRFTILLIAVLFHIGAYAQATPDKQSSGKILVAYFSWGGNTQKVAGHIVSLTGGLYSVSSQKSHTLQNTPRVPKWRKRRKKPMHVPPLKTKSRIGISTMLSSSVVLFGGIQPL